MMNHAYEDSSTAFRAWFDLLFGAAEMPCEFAWQCRFLDKTFDMPVYPELERSWGLARIWRWVPNRIIRRFYEFYIREHAPGLLLDVGANDGTHMYPFAAHGYDCLCFEPQPSCVAYIDRVIRLNGWSKARIEDCVLGRDNAAEVEFFVSKSTWYSSLIKENVEKYEPSHAITVKSVSLDSYCSERQLRPTFVKIDVEGAECDVMEGGKNLFERSRPEIFAEISSDRAKKEKIWGFFQPLGYRFYYTTDTQRPFQPVLTFSEFFAAGGAETNGDFILLAEEAFADKFEKVMCKTGQ